MRNLLKIPSSAPRRQWRGATMVLGMNKGEDGVSVESSGWKKGSFLIVIGVPWWREEPVLTHSLEAVPRISSWVIFGRP